MRNINQPSVVPRRRQFLEVVAATLSTTLFQGTGASANQQTRDSSSASSTAAVIDDLVAANRILAKEGIVDGYGHVSARHPTSRERFLMSRSVAPESVEAADIMEYDLDAQPIDALAAVLSDKPAVLMRGPWSRCCW